MPQHMMVGTGGCTVHMCVDVQLTDVISVGDFYMHESLVVAMTVYKYIFLISKERVIFWLFTRAIARFH